MSVAKDGYLYFTVNQLNFNPYLSFPAGVERRQKVCSYQNVYWNS